MRSKDAVFGLPDERFRTRRGVIEDACAAEARNPASVEVTVGIDVQKAPEPDDVSLPLDRGALTEAFAAWRAEGVDHLQVGVSPSTTATFDVVLEAIGAA